MATAMAEIFAADDKGRIVGCKPEVEGGGSQWLWNPLRSTTTHRKLSTLGRKQQGRAQCFRPSVGDKEGREREIFREEEGKMSGL
jgi:hypothetical protein